MVDLIEVFINVGTNNYTLYPTESMLVAQVQNWINLITLSSDQVPLWNSQCLLNQNMQKTMQTSNAQLNS